MGNCLSSQKSDGGNQERTQSVEFLPASHEQILQYHLGLSQPESHSHSRHRTRRNVPLDKRLDRALKRHVWTHDEANGPPPTLHQLELMREEFWHTRVTGREEVWNTVRTVIEMLMVEDSDDALETAREMLRAAEITVPSGNLCGSVYDLLGNRYRFPPFVVSNPTNVRYDSSSRSSSDSDRSLHTSSSYKSTLTDSAIQRIRATKGKGPAHQPRTDQNGKQPEQKTAIFRMPNTMDYKIEFWADEPLGDIVIRLMDDSGTDSSKYRLKIALGGSILYMDKTLVSQGWRENIIISVLVQDYRIIGSSHTRRHSATKFHSSTITHTIELTPSTTRQSHISPPDTERENPVSVAFPNPVYVNNT